MAKLNRPVAVAAFGTVLEWYDFNLYLYMTPILSVVFFGDAERSVLWTLGTFAAAYLLRPVGALLFGWIGDRYGRRFALLVSVTLMTLVMFATALLPTAATAGALLITVRCLTSLSVGGEYTGALTYVVESVSDNHRGLAASVTAGASGLGALAAAGVTAACTHAFGTPAMQDWAWRIPILTGAALGIVLFVLRFFLPETEAFDRIKNTVKTSPATRVVAGQGSAVWRTFAISALGSVTYYVGVTYLPTYLDGVTAIGEARLLDIATVAAFGIVVVSPLFGWLSDLLGRRPVMTVLAAATALLSIPLFLFSGNGSVPSAIAGSIALAVLAAGVSAVAAAMIPEQFAAMGRMTGLALGYNLAAALVGGLAPLVAQLLLEATGLKASPAFLAVAIGVLVIPVVLRCRETARAGLHDFAPVPELGKTSV